MMGKLVVHHGSINKDESCLKWLVVASIRRCVITMVGQSDPT